MAAEQGELTPAPLDKAAEGEREGGAGRREKLVRTHWA